jgi:hypothetical protein
MKDIIGLYLSIVFTISNAYNIKKNMNERDEYIIKYKSKIRIDNGGCSNCLTKKEYLICSNKRKMIWK